ncbi:MAG: ribonuclease H-like domain-containing protein, partial [Smithellaceae bacterium]|nr:ribonuclease H-like domain-containing protein [Smithellaceae bacterium]
DLRRRIDSVVTRAAMRSKAAQDEARLRGNQGLAEILSGEEIENEHGRFFLVSDRVSGASRHGHRNLLEAFDLDMSAAAMLANNPLVSEYRSSDALFLDTETTGLAGGTGTMAFLIGVGWMEGDHFQVRQILARDFGEEKAALTYLKDIAARKRFLITFNGKAFDINLLATRFIMNRMQSDLPGLPHLDLLHPSRRLLGHRLENCRLATLEADILGVQREGDIPGWEIPQRYFDWLRKRDPRLLASIFEHHRLDVISMAPLTAHLVEILTAQAPAPYTHTDDYLAAARLLLTRANATGAQKILDIFHDQTCSDFSLQSKKKLAQLYKRTGRMDEAVQIWRQMAACEPIEFYAVSELAKYQEHHEQDYSQARALIESALAGNNTFSEQEQESLSHRLKRLKARLKPSR